MANNESAHLDIHIAEGAEILGSEIGVIHYHGNNFQSSYQEAKESIFDDLEELENQDNNYTDKFQVFNNIDDYLLNNFQLFETVMKQICCGKANIPTINQIRRFLIFCANVITSSNDSDSSIDLNKIAINDENYWLFSPHGYDDVTIEIAMAKILSYFNRNKNSSIKNGTCFVSNILYDERLECSICRDGALNVEEDFKVLNDFMNTNQPITFKDIQIQRNYFEIHTSRNLKFKCGNCITSIGRCEESKRVLKGGIYNGFN